ncbi:hypothetical protein EV360DRAFT_47516 [Lentinula raphanica]|nr:hypothetical protein EV360DRAFT_47516 [Lentinula raphanica]
MSAPSQRGFSPSTLISRSTFVFFRAITLPFQYAILTSGPLAVSLVRRLGGTPIPPTVGHPLHLLGLNTGLSVQRAIFFGMVVGSVMKQSYWAMFISREKLSVGASALVGVLQTVGDGLNVVLFTNTATSALAYSAIDGEKTALSVPFIVGSGMYVLGIVLEWGSEMQRSRFKKDPKNEGRLYTRGLFRLARHINYGGYVLWRAGFALAAAGWTGGAIMGSLGIWKFVNSAIPELDDYCSKRYNEQWAQYKKAVPYKLFPFIL